MDYLTVGELAKQAGVSKVLLEKKYTNRAFFMTGIKVVVNGIFI